MVQSLTPPGAAPDSTDRTTFASRYDARMAWQATNVTEMTQFGVDMAALAAAMNLNDTTSTSTTSMSLTTGSQAFTVDTGKSYVIGMTVKCARTSDGTKNMTGEVTAYNSGTGAITVNFREQSAVAGPFTDWTISFASLPPVVGDHIVEVHTGNGHGSTNTMIRRFTTTLTNTGTDITYADSATLGASFTINTNGFYAISYSDTSSASQVFGLSVDSSELTTRLDQIAVADRLVYVSFAAGDDDTVTYVGYFAASSVIRPHTKGDQNNTTDLVKFSIRKIGNG